MSYKLLFINGWGFDSSFWEPVRKIIKKRKYVNSTQVVDINSDCKFLKEQKNLKVIYITHSIGLNWFLKKKRRCNGLINFFSAPNFFNFQKEKRKTKKIVDLMIKQLDYQPSDVLKKFHKNCGIENFKWKKIIEVENLKINLLSLLKKDFSYQFKNLNVNILSLISEDDLIFNVCKKKIQALKFPKHKIVNLKKKSHGFPMLDPLETSNIIEEFIMNLNNE